MAGSGSACHVTWEAERQKKRSRKKEVSFPPHAATMAEKELRREGADVGANLSRNVCEI
jgi:hypothetical protein